MDIKYIIPLLTPSAVDCPSSFSKTARHMAHCAFECRNKAKIKKQKTNLDFKLYIIRRNQDINQHSSYSYIQPHWKCDLCYFLMFFKIIGNCPNISYQNKRYDNNGKQNMGY